MRRSMDKPERPRRVIGMMLRRAMTYQHGSIVHEDALSPVSSADRPQCQSRKIRRPAHGCPGIAISNGHLPRTELAGEVNEELAVRREVALVGVEPAAEPLARLEMIVAGIP